MQRNKSYKVKPLVICTKQLYGAVLFDVENRYSYHLNEHSLHIWNGYLKNLNVTQIVDSLMEFYEIKEQDAFDSVIQFTQQMEEEGLLTTA